MVLVQFGFDDERNACDIVGNSPLSPGYIKVSQQNGEGEVVSSQWEIIHLILELPELMSGLSTFFNSDKMKNYSFVSSHRNCYILLDRQKSSMIQFQTRDSTGVHSEAAVKSAFKQAIIRFVQEEYTMIRIHTDVEHDVDVQFREGYQDFLTRLV